MGTKKEEAIAEAIKVGKNQMLFCGPISNGIKMVEDDYGLKFTSAELDQILTTVNEMWGVKGEF